VRRQTPKAGQLGRLLLAIVLPTLVLAGDGFERQWHWFQQDIGHSVALADDGGYLVSGETSIDLTTYGIVLAQTDSAGDTTWVRHILGVDQSGGYACRLLDGGYAVLGTSNNGVIFVRKYSSSGDSVWTYVSTWRGLVSAVIATADSGCAVAGRMPDTIADFGFIKLRGNGTEEWARYYDDPMPWATWAHNAAQTRDGGYILCGDGHDYSYTYLRMVRINASGDTIWSRLYLGLIAPYLAAVRELSDGGFLASGYTYDTLTSQKDLYLLRTNSTGDTLWTGTIKLAGADAQASAMSETGDGGYIIAGSADWYDSARVWLIKTDAGGNTVWTRFVAGPGSQIGADIRQTPDGGYAIGGTSDSAGGSVLLIKTDSLGRVGVTEDRTTPVRERVVFSVTPNPSNGVVEVKWSSPAGTGQATLRIYDSQGRLVGSSFVIRPSPFSLHLRSLPAGVYVLCLESDRCRATRKLVID